MNRKTSIILLTVFVVMLGCVRLVHELSGSTEDGNLPVNAVCAAVLTAAVYGIYRIYRHFTNK